MKKRSILTGLVCLLLFCTACKIPDIEMPGPDEEIQEANTVDQRPPVLSMPARQADAPEDGGEEASAPDVEPEAEPEPEPEPESTEPQILSSFQTEPVLTTEKLPDYYDGLELPVQGATGYACVRIPLWRELEDREAARQAVSLWDQKEAERKKAYEEAERLKEERQKKAEEEARRQEEARQQEAERQQALALQGGLALPEGEPAAGPEAVPEPQPVAEPEPEIPYVPAEPETQRPSTYAGALSLLPAGTAFTVLEEQGSFWKIQCTTDYQENGESCYGEVIGWVEHRNCMINLPDVIPSIIYDATNGYSSRFVSCGKPLPGITGQALYTGKITNNRLGEKEFMMPVLYSMAPNLCAAQHAALAEGNCLILYEGYRPLETQLQVSTTLQSMMNQDAEIKAAVSSSPWGISWFIATSASNHQHGYAVDVSLARVVSAEERKTGEYRYIKVDRYDLYQMPTEIHELSRAAATFTTPVASNSTTAWKSATLAPSMNASAIGLQGYCTNASLTPLASEWWHFNDLAARSSVLGELGKGEFEIRICRSTAP